MYVHTTRKRGLRRGFFFNFTVHKRNKKSNLKFDQLNLRIDRDGRIEVPGELKCIKCTNSQL